MWKLLKKMMSEGSRQPSASKTVTSDSSPDSGPASDVADHLSSMPLMVREVFILRVIERRSTEEIAHRLAVPPREVKRNLRQAFRILMRMKRRPPGRAHARR